MKTCPFCAEEIKDPAIVCRYCGRSLTDPTTQPSNSGEVSQVTALATPWWEHVGQQQRRTDNPNTETKPQKPPLNIATRMFVAVCVALTSLIVLALAIAISSDVATRKSQQRSLEILQTLKNEALAVAGRGAELIQHDEPNEARTAFRERLQQLEERKRQIATAEPTLTDDDRFTITHAIEAEIADIKRLAATEK